MRHLRFACLVAFLAPTALAADLPPPPPPADFTLVKWATVVDYFGKADAASDRVVVRELGQTTEGRPYLAAFVSAPETIADLERYRGYQKAIADPGDPARDAELVAKSKPVVLITCSIHSSETASTFMAMKLLHELATGDDPGTKEILDRTILILVPSANPDGVDIVADWYETTKGKPWEGEGLPKLYHKYAGHDTNRDWFMLNLQETRLLTHLLYKEWFPTMAYDVHQMGSRGARLFVPPFYDPINPNLDPRINQSIAAIGAHMASDLAAEKKSGVLTHAMYDNWWNGGNRTTPQRHNIVAVLTEAASVKLASPIFVEPDALRGATRGFSDHKPAVNFVEPWPGGWWRLADIEAYERTCARSILTLAARYGDRFQRDYLNMGRDAVAKGRTEPPFAWVVPSGGDDPGTAAEMVRILGDSGVKVLKAPGPLTIAGATYPSGSFVLPAAQPYRAQLKDMMERQVYPQRFLGNGEAEPPYDVAGWTLPLQMGVKTVTIGAPFDAALQPVEEVRAPEGGIDGDRAKARAFTIANRANDDFRVVNALIAAGVEVRRLDAPLIRPEPLAAGTLWFEPGEKADRALAAILPRTSTRVQAIPEALGEDARKGSTLLGRRVGVYQPWVPSMDEGWTRLVLEKFGFSYATIRNADLRAGDLKSRVDTLLIPSIGASTLRDGYGANETAPEFTGGIGPEGADALRAFVKSGGRLVCLEDACPYAIEEFGLPVTNVLKGLKTSEFYGPGSIVRIRVTPGDADHPLAYGVPEAGAAYFDRSLAFDVAKDAERHVVARYADRDVLLSGWLLGEAKVRDRAAVVDLPVGEGRVVLFAFPPQHRGQPHGTFRLLFNALLR